MLILYNQKMNNHDIEIATVHYKHNLKKHNIIFGLIDKIAENIKKIPNYENSRVEIELVLTVANIVENYVSKGNKKKIDKKQIVIDALNKVFSYSEDEKRLVSSLIDFLFNNGKIKKLSFLKLAKNFVSVYLKAK